MTTHLALLDIRTFCVVARRMAETVFLIFVQRGKSSISYISQPLGFHLLCSCSVIEKVHISAYDPIMLLILRGEMDDALHCINFGYNVNILLGL